MAENVVLDHPETSPAMRVVQSVRRSLEAGELTVGDRLPSERKFSERLGVDRGTVRRGLDVLEVQGLVRSQARAVRTVVGTLRPRSSVLAQTIAVLGSAAGARISGHVEPGWADQIVQAAQQAAHGGGRHALALNPDAVAGDEISHLLAEGVAGVALADVFGRRERWLTVVERIRASGVPFVVYGDDPTFADCDRIVSDHEAGAYVLTRWLLGQGRRRPLLIVPAEAQDSYWVRQRRAGYERACREAGEPVETLVTPPFASDFIGDDRSRFAGATRFYAGCLLEALRGPSSADALLAPSDGVCPMLAAACRLHGREPGRDLAIVGYDNYWQGCIERRIEPFTPAATVDKHNAACGRALVELLLERMSRRLPDAPQRRVVAPELIVTGNVSGNK